MATVESSIDVKAGVATAYNQWAQFESFPEFMENVHSIKQTDNRRLHWVAEIAGKTREWDAEIVEQIPDQRIAWASISGKPNRGVVTFQPLSDHRCRVHLRMEYEPRGAMERVDAVLGLVDRQAKGDLERFKRFIESRGEATGEWSGAIAA
jgi:uncharacterized membrane protein